MEPTQDLSTDRPTAAELLEIIAATLADSVVPAAAPHAQHQARVAANLCRILARELAAERHPQLAFADSLLNADTETADAAYVAVLELVQAKLAINKPGYDAHGAAEERAIIA